MSRAVDLLLGEILEAIELLQRYTDGLAYEDFAGDVEKQDAGFGVSRSSAKP